MQKELLQLQQMIVELRMKKDLNEIKGRFQLKRKLIPLGGKLVESGLKNYLSRGVLNKVVSRVGRLLKSKSLNRQ